MRRVQWFFVLACAISVCGCMRMYHIEKKDETTIPGLPFYTKKAACKQSTGYLEPVYVITVRQEIAYLENGVQHRKTIDIGTREITLNTFTTSREFEDLRTLFATNSQPTTQDVLDALHRVPSRNASSVFKDENRILAMNVNNAVFYVDYSTTYYFNVNRPWFGTTTTDVSYRDDGTLSSVDVTLEDTTGETIVGLVPFSEVMTAIFEPSVEDRKRAGVREDVRGGAGRLLLKVEAIFYRHVLSLLHGLDDAEKGLCGRKEAIRLDPSTIITHNYTRERVSSVANGAREEKKKRAIGVLGEITLPDVGDGN